MKNADGSHGFIAELVMCILNFNLAWSSSFNPELHWDFTAWGWCLGFLLKTSGMSVSLFTVSLSYLSVNSSSVERSVSSLSSHWNTAGGCWLKINPGQAHFTQLWQYGRDASSCCMSDAGESVFVCVYSKACLFFFLFFFDVSKLIYRDNCEWAISRCKKCKWCGSVTLKTLLCLRIPTSYIDTTMMWIWGRTVQGKPVLEIVTGSHLLIFAWIIHIYMHRASKLLTKYIFTKSTTCSYAHLFWTSFKC